MLYNEIRGFASETLKHSIRVGHSAAGFGEIRMENAIRNGNVCAELWGRKCIIQEM